MPLYFFNILYQTTRVQDEQGAELPDLNAAHEEAMASARDVVSVAFKEGFRPGDIADGIEIADADGRRLALVPFRAVLNGKGPE